MYYSHLSHWNFYNNNYHGIQNMGMILRERFCIQFSIDFMYTVYSNCNVGHVVL